MIRVPLAGLAQIRLRVLVLAVFVWNAIVWGAIIANGPLGTPLQRPLALLLMAIAFLSVGVASFLILRSPHARHIALRAGKDFDEAASDFALVFWLALVLGGAMLVMALQKMS